MWVVCSSFFCSFTVQSVTCVCAFQEEMNLWIQAISTAVSSDGSEVIPSSHSTPAASRAQTLPASVAMAAESSPGKREKDKEKRFSLFSKKK